MLPTTDFFGTQITRLLLGDNHAHGNTYIHDLISREDMSDFYTHDNIIKMLSRAKETGCNTILALASPEMIKALRQFNAGGDGLHIIFQTYPPNIDRFAEVLDEMMELNPLAIYHQGSTGEYLVETGDIGTYLANVDSIRKKGVPTGMAFHDPANVLRAERENWGADFYVLCPYNTRKNRKGHQSSFITGQSKSELVFHPDDRHIMYPIIRDIPKPVIVIKVLAGGQVFIGKEKEDYPRIAEEYIAEAFAKIKPIDTICIGVFQRDMDQLKQNAEIIARVLG